MWVIVWEETFCMFSVSVLQFGYYTSNSYFSNAVKLIYTLKILHKREAHFICSEIIINQSSVSFQLDPVLRRICGEAFRNRNSLRHSMNWGIQTKPLICAVKKASYSKATFYVSTLIRSKDLECILVFRSAMPRGVTVVCIYVPILPSLHLWMVGNFLSLISLIWTENR